MEVRSYRAGTFREALHLVRSELGHAAAVIETKEVRSAGWRGLFGQREVQVTASSDLDVESRLESAEATVTHPDDESHHSNPFRQNPTAQNPVGQTPVTRSPVTRTPVPPIDQSFRDRFRRDLMASESVTTHLAESTSTEPRLPESLFRVFAELVEAEVPEAVAQELINQARAQGDAFDENVLKHRILRNIEQSLNIGGPIQVTPGNRRIVALVGPTGVGKTTTIAKLAANFRLRDNHKVGFITVDTYRIAAVDQLRTYADIIDLPMEVVSTPREMRDAVCRLSHLDLILMDTAGRSPRDELKLQELKTMVTEAGADEVHLVLSASAGAQSLTTMARCFSEVGANSLILTKLDEATGLGSLLPLLDGSELPLRYMTNGQNVPDDIFAADRSKLAKSVLGGDSALNC